MVNWFNGFSAIRTLQTGFSKVHVPFQLLQNIAVAVVTRTQFGPDAHHPHAHIFDAENWAFFTPIADHVSHERYSFHSLSGQ